MALVDFDSWQTEFESCRRLGNSILLQFEQKEKTEHLSLEYDRFAVAIGVSLKQYEREVQELKFKLNEAIKNNIITSADVQQRQKQLMALQTKLQQLQSKFEESEENDSAVRFQRLGPVTNENESQDRQQRMAMIEEQNRGLETLSQTISRQRQLATQLGQEVDDQNDILDNLANSIERVETGVSLETRNIGLINRRDSTWGYWVVIFALMVIIIIVAVL